MAAWYVVCPPDWDNDNGEMMTASAVAIAAAIATIAKEALLHCGSVVVGTVEGTDDGIRWNWNTRGHKSRR